MKTSKFFIAEMNTIIKNSNSLTFTASMKEWRFAGDVIYYNGSNKTCELCGKKNLRYRFKIFNIVNGATLHVGSSCINKFEEIEVLCDAGHVIFDPIERKKQLEKILLKLRKNQSALQPLRNLYVLDKSNRDVIFNTVKFYNSEGLWPGGINDLFIRMDKCNIKYNPKNYMSG